MQRISLPQYTLNRVETKHVISVTEDSKYCWNIETIKFQLLRISHWAISQPRSLCGMNEEGSASSHNMIVIATQRFA